MNRFYRPGLALPLARVAGVAPTGRALARRPGGGPSFRLRATIIDRHIKEIGGREAVLAHSSTHATGTVSLPAAGIKGTLEAFHAKPNKFLQRLVAARASATSRRASTAPSAGRSRR